jgi:hypothetical protein
MSSFLGWNKLEFRYEPYPIGLAKPVMAADTYRTMVDNFPDSHRFKHIRDFGSKFSLSEKFNSQDYEEIIRTTPIWQSFHSWVKSPEFIAELLNMLRRHHIDLGLSARIGFRKHMKRAWQSARRGHLPRLQPHLNARFEFSMLPADGGHILPHTDSPGKVITIVISMLRQGEWQPEFGGGTDVNRALKPEYQFNYLNRQAHFSDMQVLHTYEFAPNQAILFVKTFNSWHSVRPMMGTGSPLMRRTLTINVEEA